MPVSTAARVRLARVLSVTVIVVPALAGLSACELEWTEGICMTDEAWVDPPGGGGDCRDQLPTDPDCPDGEIPRDRGAGREVTCVRNDVSQPPYSTT